ncbi:MAG: hypothetical protein ACPGXK_13280 [Phycisphaerae bacterium]
MIAEHKQGEQFIVKQLEDLIDQQVVLDTQTPIVYIGILRSINDYAFLLEDVDMHDCRDGHAQKEEYLAKLCHSGVTVNRRQIVVMKHFVVSVSRLSDVVIE